MIITSYGFAAFVIITILIYYLLPRRAQNFWLLTVSYIFHVTWAWQYAAILLAITAINFAVTRAIEQTNHRRGALLWLGIGANLIVLVGFRLQEFFVPDLQNFLSAMGVKTSPGALQLLLPIGLSYYILENISYLLDVYRKQLPPARDFVDYALYLAYFPKLVAGPIERARSFLPILAKNRIVTHTDLQQGLFLILIGAFRKLVVADALQAAMPWDLYIAPANFSAVELWGWLVVYAFILYNDFAGYTSIVRGVSRLFGIELSPNFDVPYFSRTFSEFWNRWHITLSHWLRDYIYFPILRALAKRIPSREHPAVLIVPPLVTMLASGLWHGFRPEMLLWGLMHGVYLAIERFYLLNRPAMKPDELPVLKQLFASTIVFLFVCLAWVPFRLEFSAALAYWQGMFAITNWDIYYRRIFLIIPFLLVVVSLDWLQFRARDEYAVLRWPRLARSFIFAGSTFIILIAMYTENVEPFVYQGF
jgi:alginate O-acetyltransferase complex protein AlgI